MDRSQRQRRYDAWKRLRLAIESGDSEQVSEFLQDSDPDLRAHAARGLAKATGASAGTALLDSLDSETDPMVRSAVVGALASIRNPDTAPTLFRFLEDDSEEVRRLALRGLSYLRDRRVLEVAPAIYSQSGWLTRQEALDALTRLHTPEAEDSLEALLSAEPRWTRRRAITKALRRSRAGWDD